MTTVSTGILRIAAALCGLLPALALAADPIALGAGQFAYPGLDGRVFGHIAYGEAAPGDLASAPAGFAVGQPCRVQRDMLPDLARLLAAATATAGVRLRAVSCFRSIAHQRAVFCSQGRLRRQCRDAMERARSVGPPGHSEHSTGYAIDFGIRPQAGCPDVDPCFAATTTGQWLLAHAPEFGFELSFPAGNAQGVTWEPWHWRWVGTAVTEPGAVRARLAFSRARANFPASPGINDASDYWLIPPRSVIAAPATMPIAPPPTP